MIFPEVPKAEVRFFAPTEDLLAEHQSLKIVLHLDYYRRKPLSLAKELGAQRAVRPALRGTARRGGDRRRAAMRHGRPRGLVASRDPEANPWGRVVVNAEPALNPESRVMLSEARDAFGLRRVRLDWQTQPVDDRTIRARPLAFAAHSPTATWAGCGSTTGCSRETPLRRRLRRRGEHERLAPHVRHPDERRPRDRRGRPRLPGARDRQPLRRRLERLRLPGLPEPHLHHRPARAPPRRPPGGDALPAAAPPPRRPPRRPAASPKEATP